MPYLSNEFSRRYSLAELPAKGQEVKIIADTEECVALAGRFALLALHRLEATVRLLKRGNGLRLEVRYCCEGNQECVVSLAAAPFAVNGCFQVNFSSGNTRTAGQPVLDEEDIESDQADDFVDAFRGGVIDVGECIAQHFGSSLDPYPRAPDAALGPADLPAGVGIGDRPLEEARKTKVSPFEALAALKHRGK